MRGLVWKELREWGPISLGILVPLCVVWSSVSSQSWLIAPRQEPTLAVIAVACLFGLAFGYGQCTTERMRGTQGYLAHRAGGRSALLCGKFAVGIPLALLLAMLPPLVGCAWQLFGSMAGVAQPARAFEHALAGLAALPTYASGVFIALVAPSVLLALSLGSVALAGCFLFSLWLPSPALQMSPWTIPLFAVGELALAAAVVALAAQFFLRVHDRDAVLPFPLQVGAAGFALLLFVVPASWGFGSGVRNGQQSLFNGYPLLVRYADGHYAQMERSVFQARINSGEPARITFTLPDGTVASEPDPALAYNPAPPLDLPASLQNWPTFQERGVLSDSRRWLPLFVGRFASPGGTFLDTDGHTVHPAPAGPGPGLADETYFDIEAGVVRQFQDLPGRDFGAGAYKGLKATPRQTVLRRPDGKPFSRATLVIMDEMQAPLLVDLEDQTAWMLDFAKAQTRLARIPLPQDDQLLGVEPKQQWDAEGWSSYNPSQAVLVGAHGRYQWTTVGFKPTDAQEARPWWLRHCRGEAGEASLTEMTVRLRDLDAQGNVGPESEIAFVQRYEPRTPGEQMRAALMRLGIQCGPPVFSALRLVTPSSEPVAADWVPRALLVPRDSARVHLAHVLLGIALGAWTLLLVARRGGTTAERVFWCIFVALFGVLALAFLSFLAPRPSPLAKPHAARAAPKKSGAPLAAT